MKKISTIFFLIILISCSTKPEAINYTVDPCQFCKMTIMQPAFACELVNKKGKTFKFDDISCMIKYLKAEERNEEEYAHKVVNIYGKDQFIDVKTAIYFQSESFKSPMRGDVAAFGEKPSVDEMKIDLNKVLTWEEIYELF